MRREGDDQFAEVGAVLEIACECGRSGCVEVIALPLCVVSQGRQFGTALRVRHYGLVSKERSRPMAVQAQEQAPEHAELANELLERIGQTVGQRAQASTIFGEAVEREGVTVIPVAKARFGFGGGGGGGARGEKEQGSGGGGGGGVAVSPIGYIELRDHGSAFIRIRNSIDLVALVVAGALAAISVKRLLG